MSTNQGNKLDGDRFQQLHSEYRDRLVSRMTSMLRDRDAAEDITAFAFAKGFEQRNRFRGESALHTWVFAIAMNEARQAYKRQQRTVPLETLADGLPTTTRGCDAEVVSRLESANDHDRLHRSLAQLPARYRRLIVGRFFHGLSTAELARREGIPQGTALSRIHAAKRLLRQAWEAAT